MKSRSNGATAVIARLRRIVSRNKLADGAGADDYPPLRAELFSADQMEQHGKTLAQMHRPSPERNPDLLLERLAENEAELHKACSILTDAVKANRRITPAGEWLLDNYYLIDDQIRTAKRHLPRNYSRELPRLANGPSAGLPRAYDIALEAVAHGDGRLDAQSLGRFIAAYQTVSTLKLGELWAIPIMLRLALIENLRRVAARISANRAHQNQADYWADQMMEVAEKDPKSLILVIADMARSDQQLVSPFVAVLARRLQGQSAALALPLTWIEQRLSESDSTIEQLVQAENQNQAAAQVSISNSIGSLRVLGAIDWREFVETQSVVEQKLLEDPNGVYGRMNFATRDRYRHAVEQIAKNSSLSEGDVARKAIQLAHEGAANAEAQQPAGAADLRVGHVGYYLIGNGLSQLEAAAEATLPFADAVARLCRRVPLFLYLGGILLLTAGFTAALAIAGSREDLPDWRLALWCVPLAICMSQLAVSLVNWLASVALTPQAVPRMDLSKGIPAEFRTLVTVPCMLSSTRGIEDMLEALEVRFLANRDAHLHFSLLTDFADAGTETLPDDAGLMQLAKLGIEQLNRKYVSEEGDTFFLFHRPRRWNPGERQWMGYERKRGKLGELNSLLQGGTRHHFSLIVGNTSVLSDVKFVITLDADTQLPRDSARELIGAMTHPLNHARYDAGKRRVATGYGILQPRVTASLPGTNRSRLARLCGSQPGIDPYTRAVSDVYQDLFGEGSFIGKGIYDVDAFETVLDDRFPENRILSHDLLEGCFARAGLVSDVELYEDYPARYSADVSRRHRWIRGDWQITPWLRRNLPARFVARATGLGDSPRHNPLTLLSQWKIFDNLRRSLVPAALTLTLLFGWALTARPILWTLTVLAVLFLTPAVSSVVEMFRLPDDMLPRQHLAALARTVVQHCSHGIFVLACMPHEAGYSVDAILRTLTRIFITHRHLLQWTPSGEIDNKPRGGKYMDLLHAYRAMAIGPIVAVATGVFLVANLSAAFLVAAPILCLWLASPALAWWLSLPLPPRDARLSTAQSRFLHKISRKTWAFFETFVGPDDNWLPPDNFQEHPVAVVAHRTSPTNMGLALLSNLAAYDFGYISSGQLLQRTSNAFRTMQSLERFQGHFYNWYDTQNLRPLLPQYVSSVDSGNLAGHLLTLRSGLLALADDRILGTRLFEGLSDTLRVLTDVAAAASPGDLRRLARLQKELESAYDSHPATVAATRQWLERLSADATEVQALFPEIAAPVPVMSAPAPGPATAGGARWWADALARQCKDALDELTLLAPWSVLPPAPRGLAALAGNGRVPTLRQLAAPESQWLPEIARELEHATTSEQREWLMALQGQVAKAGEAARSRLASIEELANIAGEFARMDYDFLYDKTRHLLAIGYNVTDRRRDAGEYDLLASEARLTTYVAIAQGQIPQESWFAMGRQLTAAGGDPTLMSWSGSMFEYLMPLLIMPNHENTLLDQTYRAAVERQIVYGFQRNVPWGMSECGYNAVDAALNYQYRAFGVPGLGLQRGLAADLVVAPYASALALMVAPVQACLNLQRLSADGVEGPFGYFEAIDYTPARLPRGQSSAVVRSFMAHHQAMVLLALAYLRLDRPMQKRFEAEPQFLATELLLHERVPKATAFYQQTGEVADARPVSSAPEVPIHLVASSETAIPEVQLLSNGRYHVMVTNAGGGYSRWKDFAVTRWREDTTCDNWGSFCYVRDLESGEFWSNTHQPTLKRADTYEALFSEARAEFRRRDRDYETRTEIVVSPEDDIEVRRVRITNRGRTRKTIDVTSYAEVVLATPAADALQPAFSNLFVQTEIMRQERAVICTRRPRSKGEPAAWMFHLMAVHGAEVGEVSYETDRMRFIGRGRTVEAPQALRDAGALSGTQGSVLDPIVAIRYRITLEPEQTATVDMVTGIGDTREACMGLVGKYQDSNLAERVFDLAWTHSWVSLRQINASESDAQLYGRLASSVVYANATLRADTSVLMKNRRGQSGLWSYAISGDLPIVLLQIGDLANIDLVRQLVQAHAYWRLRGLAVDLVIWNEDHAGYRQALQDQIMGLIAAGMEAQLMDRPGGIFVRRAEQISEEDRILLHSVARAIITDRRGTLAEQIRRRGGADARSAAYAQLPRLRPVRNRTAEAVPAANVPVAADNSLLFDNGLGGFSPDGREYIITTGAGRRTPLPWVNVLANAEFGTVISETGACYTWSENAHEFRLTPWAGDAVSDPSGEAFYLRDEESGYFWSPAPSPACGETPYVTRHGFGYSAFEHAEDGIRSELTVYVDLEAPVKYSVLTLTNDTVRPRRLSATGYVEWVLGDLRPKSMMHVITEVDAASGVLFARNAYNAEFAERTAFFDVDEPARSASGDRTEFIGRNGTLKNPAAMRRAQLSNKVGAALDPCGALQVPFELAPGQTRELVFTLGSTKLQRADDIGKLVRGWRGPAAARNALEAVRRYWAATLGRVQVETPDRSLNIMANGWLLYQTLACRFWGRSGYYQSGGAFGFRDQLQDSMALVHAEPRLVREHLLRCAAHQFREGDAQHWWHMPSNRGVRTRCSDDFLWLPLALCRYLSVTGDTGVLDESVHFLEGRPVNPEDDSYYDLPGRSDEATPLYDHCVRAIVRALKFGEHGLPLMGTGDWNDGMNLVGAQGKGESVWLGFFLCAVLTQFAGVAEKRGDAAFVERCKRETDQLRRNLEQHGWDGKWYRRAYFDDGTPLGSSANVECQIDSIAQSWSVLSGAGDEKRARKAMEAVDQRLVRRDHALIQLLDPPFDKAPMDPGYIKGYVPGVRENGGQYTHGAVWTAMAFAALGDAPRAWEMFGMINPVNHADSADRIATYKVEPYVVAADVYAVAPHAGRGGWTWYTGSAGWLYRLIVESLLGLRVEGAVLRMQPCLPADWKSVKLSYRYRDTVYHIEVTPAGATQQPGVSVDGVTQEDLTIHLQDDRREHQVTVHLRGAKRLASATHTVAEAL